MLILSQLQRKIYADDPFYGDILPLYERVIIRTTAVKCGQPCRRRAALESSCKVSKFENELR